MDGARRGRPERIEQVVKMKIIIPMSGWGERFRRAGYTVPKPLIEVEGRPMIEHVMGLFPGEPDSNFVFICNREHLETTPMRAVLKRLAPGGTIVQIEPHKRGPVHAVLQARAQMPADEPVIVNYCDFSARWDYEAFKRMAAESGCAGALSAYRGFHPHTLGDTHYAYMRVDGEGRMLEIREKEAFTKNRMEEYASSGTYYFSSGRLALRYFDELVARGIDKNGEYYVSLAYNLMVRDGLEVRVFELEQFLQWGTPEDLAEYVGWSEAFSMQARGAERPAIPGLQCVMPMAGAGKRFSEMGYAQPKPLIPVSGRPMFIQALRDLPAARSTQLIIQEGMEGAVRDALGREGVEAGLVRVPKLTQGQASSALLAGPGLDLDAPLLIAPCDCGFLYDAEEFERLAADARVDAVVWAFRRYVPAARRPKSYGWLDVDGEGFIRRVSCKTPVSDTPYEDYGVCGAFYYRKARFFVESAEALIAHERRINGEFYIDESVNELLEAGRRAAVFGVRHFLGWGTPDELRTYEYWQEFFDSRADHPYKRAKDADVA